MKRNERGFTLMELMVVIVIVAILAAVAVPLYINYVNDARRTEAKGAIGAIISAEQVYYQNNGHYLSQGVGTTTAIAQQLNVDLTESSRNWSFAIGSTTDADGFKVTATGANTANGLGVTYTHSRASGPTWDDKVTGGSTPPSNP